MFVQDVCIIHLIVFYISWSIDMFYVNLALLRQHPACDCHTQMSIGGWGEEEEKKKKKSDTIGCGVWPTRQAG